MSWLLTFLQAKNQALVVVKNDVSSLIRPVDCGLDALAQSLNLPSVLLIRVGPDDWQHPAVSTQASIARQRYGAPWLATPVMPT